MCNERQQLLYIKMLLLAGRCDNAIPNDPNYIKREVNYRRYPSELARDLAHLSRIFDKMKVGNESIRFLNFNELHNLGKSQKVKKGGTRADKSREREEKDKEKGGTLSNLQPENQLPEHHSFEPITFNGTSATLYDHIKLIIKPWPRHRTADSKTVAAEICRAFQGDTLSELTAFDQALKNYLASDDVTKDGGQYCKNILKWIPDWRVWTEKRETNKPSGPAAAKFETIACQGCGAINQKSTIKLNRGKCPECGVRI